MRGWEGKVENLESQDRQQSVNLMDLLFDDDWLREAVRLEDEVGGVIEAGFDWRANLGALMTNPERYSHFARLRSIVMGELSRLLAEWNLGVGTEAALACGRSLLMERLQNPAPELQEQLLTVLEEDLATPQGDGSGPQAARSGLQQLLRNILTPEDWELIAVAAGNCVREQVVERFRAVKT